MNLTKMMEIWDNLAYKIYNLISRTIYVFKYFSIHKYLKRNKILKDSHQGERCFIVLNGPSINNYDLSKLSQEYTICTNYFYQTEYYNKINPNYYCAVDSSFFNIKRNPEQELHVKNIINLNSQCKCFFNIGYMKNFELQENVYLTYSKHMPNNGYISNNLSKLSSNFISVSLYAMNLAIYLGFKNIYILGYDFEPGKLSHFYKENSLEQKIKNNLENSISKDEVCGRYWQYSVAQYQNYYMRKHAEKRKVEIYNLNLNSNVRSFKFAEFDDLFTS
ncbi:MAG: DUF115 domain-containing protein [Firmicutes bacterium]|nr:DUF115 domain-containing protein [Bacillota bacterium]